MRGNYAPILVKFTYATVFAIAPCPGPAKSGTGRASEVHQSGETL